VEDIKNGVYIYPSSWKHHFAFVRWIGPKGNV
jgi:hypothetical protein